MFDAATGLVRFGAREYDAESGQWLTPDPAGLAGGLNAYEYAGGDPIDLVDHTGELPVLALPVIGAATGAVFGFGVQLWNGTRLGCINYGDVGWRVRTGATIGFTFEAGVGLAGLGGRGAIAEGALGDFEVAGACRGGACLREGCFAAGTTVETDDGPRPIESIEVGDRVLAVEEDGGEWGYYTVTATSVRPSATFALALEDNGEGVSDVLHLTSGHPLYERTRGWTPAGNLRPGDEIFTSRGGWARVGNGTWIETAQLVYNLEVDGAHGYFVGDIGAWAHNQGLCGYNTEHAALRSLVDDLTLEGRESLNLRRLTVPATRYPHPQRGRTRIPTARACASSPSSCASPSKSGACIRIASFEYRMIEVRTKKSYTPRGEENRAAPPVGST